MFAVSWASAKLRSTCGKKQYAGRGVQELRELRSLREENGRLKWIVADLTLDRQILQEIVSKKL
jgi:putative transposase